MGLSGSICTFSYLLNTRNKFVWLQESIPRLLKAKRPGCEVVVIDGGSSDGSAEYLRKLYQAGKIDQFVSEPDCGEAHGWNKGLLLSRGDLVKLITDDDVFDYGGVDRCRQYMETHEEVDLLLTPAVNAVAVANCIVRHTLVCQLKSAEEFRQRREMNTCGLGVLLRRRSVPLLGLFNTLFVWIDYEFLLRAMHSPAAIAWFSDPVALRIHNPDSNSERFSRRMSIERKRLARYYREGQSVSLLDRFRGLKHQSLRAVAAARDFARPRQRRQQHPPSSTEGRGHPGGGHMAVRELFESGERILTEYRSPAGGDFVVSRAQSQE